MKTSRRALWGIISASALVGLTSSLLQTIERINFALHPKIALTCDINAIFSCSNVFNAWQSRVFGFSNSLVCMMFFALTAGVALAGLGGGVIHAWLRRVFHFFAVFFLGFGAWYLWQSTFRIGYICLFCLICYSAVIVMNWAWFRIWLLESKSSNKSSVIERFVRGGGDIFVSIVWAAVIAGMIYLHFR